MVVLRLLLRRNHPPQRHLAVDMYRHISEIKVLLQNQRLLSALARLRMVLQLEGVVAGSHLPRARDVRTQERVPKLPPPLLRRERRADMSHHTCETDSSKPSLGSTDRLQVVSGFRWRCSTAFLRVCNLILNCRYEASRQISRTRSRKQRQGFHAMYSISMPFDCSPTSLLNAAS